MERRFNRLHHVKSLLCQSTVSTVNKAKTSQHNGQIGVVLILMSILLLVQYITTTLSDLLLTWDLGRRPPSWKAVWVQNYISEDTSLDSTVKSAKQWFRECDADYEQCKTPKPALLPKRTIFVGSNNDDIFVAENENCSEFYTCLSHCWSGFQLLTTTSKTIMTYLCHELNQSVYGP